MNCKNKKRYTSKKLADDYTDFYKRAFFIKNKEKELSSYYCNIHHGWHVGHNKPTPAHQKIKNILDNLNTI